jgi:acyl-CoA synthetase (AMP-forming)/AMP-acid ligase II
MNLALVVLSHGRARCSALAIGGSGEALDYATVTEMLRRYAGCLAAAGIVCGDRIGLCLRDTADHLLLHYAVGLIGAVIVPIDHRWKELEKVSVARAFGCRLVVCEADDPARGAVQHLVFTTEWRREAPFAGDVPDQDEMPLVLSLSSGTTGRPTGAIVSHRQFYERFISQWAGMGFNAGDRFVLATPLYFGGGRSFAMSFLAAGGTVIFAPANKPMEIIDTARREAATVLFAVPTQIQRMTAAWIGERPAMPALRRLVTSGAAIRAEDKRRAMDVLSPALMDYYATSEGGGIAVLPPDEQLAFPDSVGRPAFRVEIELVDEDGRAVPAGSVGRLRYRGPGVSTILVDADGQTRAGPADGWFMPGDLARILPSGCVQLVGRVRDVIIRAGVNIYPAEIEAALSAHSAVAEAAVFAVPDPDLGEAVAAAVVVRSGVTLDAAELQEYVRARLASYKVPQHVVFTEALPRNAGGKVLPADLASLFRVTAP